MHRLCGRKCQHLTDDVIFFGISMSGRLRKKKTQMTNSPLKLLLHLTIYRFLPKFHLHLPSSTLLNAIMHNIGYLPKCI